MTTRQIQLEKRRLELISAIDILERELSSPPPPYMAKDILRILDNSRATLRQLDYLISRSSHTSS